MHGKVAKDIAVVWGPGDRPKLVLTVAATVD